MAGALVAWVACGECRGVWRPVDGSSRCAGVVTSREGLECADPDGPGGLAVELESGDPVEQVEQPHSRRPSAIVWSDRERIDDGAGRGPPNVSGIRTVRCKPVLASSTRSVLPIDRAPPLMQHSNNAGKITRKDKVHGVGKLVHERATDWVLNDGKLQRIVAEAPKDDVKF